MAQKNVPFGEDVGALVLDVGYSNTWLGYAGDNSPKQCIASYWCEDVATQKMADEPFEPWLGRTGLKPERLIEVKGRGEPLGSFIGAALPKKRNSISKRTGGTISPPENKQIVPLKPRLNKRVLSKVVSYLATRALKESLEQRPVLASVPTISDPAYKEAMGQVLFEECHVGSFFASRKAVLGAFSVGRSTAAVCEMGPMGTTISPVYEGYTLTKKCLYYPVGGNLLDWAVGTNLNLWSNSTRSFSDDFLPFFCYKQQPMRRTESAVDWFSNVRHQRNRTLMNLSERASFHPAYMHLAQRRLLADIKATVLKRCGAGKSSSHNRPPAYPVDPMAAGSDGEGFSNSGMDGRTSSEAYELPDGQIIALNKDVAEGIMEFWFNPRQGTGVSQALLDIMSQADPGVTTFPGLPIAVVKMASNSPVDSRREILSNVVVLGGPSQPHGFLHRLASEFSSLKNVQLSDAGLLDSENTDPFKKNKVADVTQLKIRVCGQGTAKDRTADTWIGGSVMASLSSFQQMWVSKAEYDECGSNIFEQRCVF